MWIAPGKIESFLRKPDAGIRNILVFGPDQTLVSERIDQLTRAYGVDPKDPFQVDSFTGDSIHSDPATLYDAIAAQSLMGGDRVVRIIGSGENGKSYMKEFIADRPEGAVLLMSAGDIPRRRSDLVKLFENDDSSAAIACYEDGDRDKEAVIMSMVREAGHTIDHDAVAWTAETLAGGRGIARREIEKLVLNAVEGKRITLDDARSVITSDHNGALDGIADLVGTGNLPELNKLFQSAEAEGTSPIGMVRAVTNHFLKLVEYRRIIDQGTPVDTALKSQRPPIFYQRMDAVKRQVRIWSIPMLETQLLSLSAAETEVKRTGMPARPLVERCLLQIAVIANRR